MPRYPGIISTIDGARAVVWVEAHIAQAAFVFPVAPSAAMADAFALEYQQAHRNVWGEPLELLATESEHSAASACEGFALAGGRATTFTSGQGLLLMKEVLHSIAGKRLPLVFHVATRALTSHACTLHCGHDDLMGVADCGWGILVARNAQEAADLTLIARRVAESAETPFLCAQDGFLTSHTLQTARVPEPELMRRFAGKPDERLRAIVRPEVPLLNGPVQGPDSFMLGRVAQRFFHGQVCSELQSAFSEFAHHTGRHYGSLRCYAMDDAEYAFVGMGSMMETAEATVDYMRRSGIRVGAVSVLSYRPFPAAELAVALGNCSVATVFERLESPLSEGGPLVTEIRAAFASEKSTRMPELFSAVCGIGGRDVRPGHFVAAANNMLRDGRRSFVLGIKHPDAVELVSDPDVRPTGSFTVRGHTVGGIGSASASEILAAIASELFGLHVHSHVRHGLEKRGLPTTYHLTLAPDPVRVHGLTDAAEFVAISDPQAFEHGDPLDGLMENGTLYVEGSLSSAELWKTLPSSARQTICRRHIRFCSLDAARLAREAAKGRAEAHARLRAVAFLGVFLRVSKFRQLAGLSDEQLFAAVEKLLEKFTGEHQCDCIEAALTVIRRAYSEVEMLECPGELDATGEPAQGTRRAVPPAAAAGSGQLVASGFADWVVGSYVRGREADLAADAFSARGLMPAGTASLRSFRRVTPALPVFRSGNCDGCVECVNYCPDAAITVRVLAPAVVDAALERVTITQQRTLAARSFADPARFGGGRFGLFIDPDKCKGCGECVVACGQRGALSMVPKAELRLADYESLLEFASALPATPQQYLGGSAGDVMISVCAKGFHGGAESCLGCGEASAVRMLLASSVQEYGSANVAVVAAPGCPSEFSSVYPFNPYEISWTNTLLENSAAEAIGLRMRWDQQGQGSRRLWVLGGYTAMFDSGLQALSRMLMSGLDIKVFVVDTEIYSGTGGQTLTDSFARGPAQAHVPVLRTRRERRKELGQLALMHPGVYVAQTTAAHLEHFYAAVREANAFPGPAVVICYASCAREHGIGAGQTAAHARLAVASRAFPLFVFDPRKGERISDCLSLAGNPEQAIDFLEFARSEPRFAKHFNEDGEADQFLLFAREDRQANWRRLEGLAGE